MPYFDLFSADFCAQRKISVHRGTVLHSDDRRLNVLFDALCCLRFSSVWGSSICVTQSRKTMRRNAWQRPLHILQIVGIAIYMLLVLAFYLFLGTFLGNNVLEAIALTVYALVAFSVMVLFLRCSSIDPVDKSLFKNAGPKSSGSFSGRKVRVLLARLILRYVKRMEKNFLHSCIRRKYSDPWKSPAEMESCLPSMVTKNEAIAPDVTEDDIMFCSLCNKKVKKRSKHCKSCNKCVDGFDHHCRWLNNCIGRKNYTTFMLLMTSILIMLILEEVAGLAVFIRCFANRAGTMHDLKMTFGTNFPRGAFAAIVAVLTLASMYATAALGQLFIFHIVLIKKGIRTYDYILAMRDECSTEDFLDESDLLSNPSSPASSVESTDGTNFLSRFSCLSKVFAFHQENAKEIRRLSLGLDLDSEMPKANNQANATINPWKLIKMTRYEALKASEKARERSSVFQPVNGPSVTHIEVSIENTHTSEHGDIARNSTEIQSSPEPPLLMPLPLERKRGPSIRDSYVAPADDISEMEVRPLLMGNLSKSESRVAFGRKFKIDSCSASYPVFPSTSVRFPKFPNRTDSVYSATNRCQSFKSPLALQHRTNFDLNLTQVSTELETYISKQVVHSLFRQSREEGSPIQ